MMQDVTQLQFPSSVIRGRLDALFQTVQLDDEHKTLVTSIVCHTY
jgi:hypothetical protein